MPASTPLQTPSTVAPAPRTDSKPAAVALPPSYNYIGAFLTFRCPFNCSYCINKMQNAPVLQYEPVSGAQWINFFERLETGDVPITLQGGEPGSHPDFLDIVEHTSRFAQIDILTNLAFDLREFCIRIDPALVNREAPYAPIRVSYHPEQFSLEYITKRVRYLVGAGFRVGIYGVTHPSQLEEIRHAQKVCNDLGLDFRTKPFLGWYQDRLHGEYAYPEACAGPPGRSCECAPSELLIAPDGSIHRCHNFLYQRRASLSNMNDATIELTEAYLPCPHFGLCNPCDVKVKNNRFQQFGHVSAKIRNIQ
jgi:hypothetical protein